jgi:hypothetical protein
MFFMGSDTRRPTYGFAAPATSHLNGLTPVKSGGESMPWIAVHCAGKRCHWRRTESGFGWWLQGENDVAQRLHRIVVNFGKQARTSVRSVPCG